MTCRTRAAAATASVERLEHLQVEEVHLRAGPLQAAPDEAGAGVGEVQVLERP